MPFKIKNTAERLVHLYEGAQIFYHRLLYRQQRALIAECTERGETDWSEVQIRAAEEMIDGWDDHVQDADGYPLAVPTGRAPDDNRAQIRVVVNTFPTDLIVELATLAFTDHPEEVIKNFRSALLGNSLSQVDAPDTSLPVETVDESDRQSS